MKDYNIQSHYLTQDKKDSQTEKQLTGIDHDDHDKTGVRNVDQEDVIDKILRQPRSKKYMKAMKDIDIPSLTDIEIIERMKKRYENQGVELEVNEIKQEDIKEFAKRCLEEVKNEIQKEKEEEEHRLREAEEHILLMTLSLCAIQGCMIHAIDKYGNIIEHYRSIDGLPKQADLGYQLLINKRAACVEVYKRRLVLIGQGGEVLEVRRLSDDEVE